MLMSRAAKTRHNDDANDICLCGAITLIKSALSDKGDFAPFEVSVAPSSGSETRSSLLHWRSLDSVWRNVFPTSLLPAIASAPTLPRWRAFLPGQQYLYHSRDAVSTSVPDHSRAWSPQCNGSAAPQRRFPRLSRVCRPIPIPPRCDASWADWRFADCPNCVESTTAC